MKIKIRTSFLYLSFLILLFSFSCQSQKDDQAKADFPTEQLREGDIVFRKGVGVVSRAVLTADKNNSHYSHIGIVVKHKGKWKVVHAVPGEPEHKGDPDRVKMDDIEVFFRKDRAKAGAVMRAAGNEIRSSRAAKRAIRLYDTVLLFDHNYDLTDSSQMYCTELIDYVFKKEGVDLTEGRLTRLNAPGFSGDYIFPSDIQQSNKLTLIYSF